MGLADEEREWIRQSRQGDAQAYRHLVERYQNRIYRLVSGLLGYDHGNVDDVVQEVFVKAYFSLRRFREEAAFATWIYRIAVNRARDEVRRASRRLSLDTSLSRETVQALQGIWNQAQDEENVDPAASESLRRFVSQAIAALPDKLRTVVTLKDLEDLSYQEVGPDFEVFRGDREVEAFPGTRETPHPARPPPSRSASTRERLMIREEKFWRRCFASAARAEPIESLWPGILAGIEAEIERRESFSTAVLLMGRRLAPAFALLLLVALGTALWGGSDTGLLDSESVLAGLMAPDAILGQWAGVLE